MVGAILFGGSLLVGQLIVYDRIVSSEIRRVEEGMKSELGELVTLFDRGGRVAVEAAQAAGRLPPGPNSRLTRDQAALESALYDQGAR